MSLLLVVLAGCGGGSDGAGPGSGTAVSGTEVVLRDIAFKPEKLSVKVGDTVTWRFEDEGIPHNVKSDDKSFESDTMDTGTFEHTFASAGTFPYVCTLHPNMKGTVVVR